jgi:sulfur relay (sulfurtransferase) DsrC/TusE family protein
MIREIATSMIGPTALILLVYAGISAPSTQAAANERSPVTISKAAAGILANPTETLPDMSEIVSGQTTFAVTADHIALLRKLRFSWETAETGAPMVDPNAPYGTPDALAAIGDISGAKTESDRARQHIEMHFALTRMLRHGSLNPGDYPALNVKHQDILKMMSGYFEDDSPANMAALGLTLDGKFRLTSEHLKLIKTLMFAWPDEEQASDRIDRGDWPAPTMDPKRPYGDMTYFQKDIADILGLKVETKDGEKVLSEVQEKAMQHLHWQMLGALQVFIENAEFKPGLYK